MTDFEKAVRTAAIFSGIILSIPDCSLPFGLSIDESISMSLFENDEYQWRETYFIFFRSEQRPSVQTVLKALQNINSNFETQNVIEDESGCLESLTLLAPDDYAAMDISIVAGQDVAEQKTDMIRELLANAAEDEKQQVLDIEQCDSRFDIYHFEQLVFVGKSPEDEDDDFLDPGTVLILMQELARLCDGIVVDPQTNTLL